MGPVSWALKTSIQRDRVNGVLKISQEQFTKAFLQAQGVSESDTSSIPVVTSGPDLEMSEEDLSGPEQSLAKFQSSIGSLWWLAQVSRPDIFFAVHRASKFQNRPSEKLWRWLKKIKSYLNATQSHGIVFNRGPQSHDEKRSLLSAFVDASFATENHQSRIGWFCLFLGNLVSWASEVPKRVMTSSTEVECRGLSQFAKENQWQRQLQSELGLYAIDSPTKIFEDNQASIAMASNLGMPHKRSKHFGIEWAHFKQTIEMEETKLVYVSTEEQAADMLTKALPQKNFCHLRDMVMGNSGLQNHFVGSIMTVSAIVDDVLNSDVE